VLQTEKAKNESEKEQKIKLVKEKTVEEEG
jgi:hypothetical protein